MKRIFTFLSILFVALWTKAQTEPMFSTAEAPVYYYIQFNKGAACLADKGIDSELQTATKSNVDAQKWAFIGTKDEFLLLGKTGRYVAFNGSRFTASSTATPLKMVATSNTSAAGCWELQRTASSKSMNQEGGTGAGKYLCEWTAGDGNNPVRFVAAQAIPPVFSTTENETWYFLQFCISGQTLQDNGTGKNVTYGEADPSDAQMWKLVGSKDNFQLVSKLGNFATIVGSGNSARLQASATPDAYGFSLTETANATYAPNWEIAWNGSNSGKNSLNRWGGGELALSEIGLWSANDNNNPISFTDPGTMTYADYNVVGIENYVPEHPQTLWYTQPATLTSAANKWMEYSLPIGNGQLGASLFGGVLKDEVQFNEKTVWTGSNALSSYGGGGYGNYQNFGSFFAEDISEGTFSYGSSRPATNYLRQLDLSTATASVSFSDADGVDYTRQYFASYPAQAIIARYAASQPGKISLRFTLKSGVAGSPSTTYSDGGEAYFQKKLDLVTCRARIKVIPKGGTLTKTSEGIEVRGADEIVVILAGGTDFDASSQTYISNTSKLTSRIRDIIQAAENKGWDALLAEHVSDYQTYFSRVNLQLGNAANTMPTDQLVDAYSKTAASSSTQNTLMLEKLYFDYGRYLEIASSRGVALPSNLQGIWNNNPTPPWNSDIHANINVQMNYWPAEPTNLSEMHMPFLDYIINMAVNHKEWQNYAKRSGQTVGWTFYTENNIFGGGSPWSDNYTIANAWYATHLWQHYRYTLDHDFLLRAFPAMWSCSQYWMERMVKASDGTYECPNEYSPEHGPQSQNATAHSQQLVVELFQNTLEAAQILGGEAGLTMENLARLTDYYEHSDKGLAKETYTGQWGNPQNGVSSGTEILREWKYSPYSVGENNHRHQSHLMCLYPYAQVTPESQYFNAAVNSLRLRSDNSTGWSMGWRINLWARAQDGDHAHILLHSALRHSTSYGTDQGRGGIYYNLYDSHAPFQIDGNFGACAGIAEMLMQSSDGNIRLLPALPSVWAEGSIQGLKAVGGFSVSITWEKGLPVRAEISNPLGQKAKAIYGAYQIPIEETAGSLTVIEFDSNGIPTSITTPRQKGGTAFFINSRTVSLSGSGTDTVSIYDLQGRMLASLSSGKTRIPEAAGNVVIIKVKAKDGKTQSYKIAL